MIAKESICFEPVAVPDKYLIACSLVANRLMDIEINGDPVELNIGKDVLVQCSLEQEGGEKDHLSGIDMAVLDALHTIWEYGREDHVISPGRVYRVMVHNSEFSSPSDGNKKLVQDAFHRLRKTRIKIIQKGSPEIAEPMIRGTINQNGEVALSEEPVALRYSRQLRQITTVPAELLAVCDENGKAIQNRPQLIDVRERLLRQLVIMSRMHKKSGVIKIDTILGCTRKSITASQRAKRLDYMNRILSFWQEQGFITSFCFRKRGYEYHAIEVITPATPGNKPATQKNARPRTE